MQASTKRDRYKIDPVKFYISILENPFPTMSDEEMYKPWQSWVDRIVQGQESEQHTISKITDGMPEDVAEGWADDWRMAESISNEMFGALTVAMVAATEAHYHRCMRICDVAGKCKPNYDSVFRYKETVDYFKRTISVDINKLPQAKVVKALRTLANSYKHSSGRYGTSKKSKVDESLASTWKLVEGKMIDFSSLPFNAISVACGVYCEALSQSVCSAVLPATAAPTK